MTLLPIVLDNLYLSLQVYILIGLKCQHHRLHLVHIMTKMQRSEIAWSSVKILARHSATNGALQRYHVLRNPGVMH